MTSWATPETRERVLQCVEERGVQQAVAEFGFSKTTVLRWRRGDHEPRLDAAPFRDLCCQTIERDGITWAQLAERMGYGSYAANAMPLLRALGLTPAATRAGRGRRINYATAVKIVRACHAYPVDYGV